MNKSLEFCHMVRNLVVVLIGGVALLSLAVVVSACVAGIMVLFGGGISGALDLEVEPFINYKLLIFFMTPFVAAIIVAMIVANEDEEKRNKERSS